MTCVEIVKEEGDEPGGKEGGWLPAFRDAGVVSNKGLLLFPRCPSYPVLEPYCHLCRTIAVYLHCLKLPLGDWGDNAIQVLSNIFFAVGG
jgi:hypothetical protein